MKIRLLLLLVPLSTYSFSQTYVDTNATGIDEDSLNLSIFQLKLNLDEFFVKVKNRY